MRRLALVALLAACGEREPFPTEGTPVRVTAGVRRVALGESFPLTVERVWRAASAPEPWSDAALAPLRVRLLETRRREQEGRIAETRRYAAYAFTSGELSVAPAGSEPLRLRVDTLLDPDRPGAVEPPEGPLPAPFPAWAWPALGTLALAALFLLYRARRRAPPLPRPSPPSTEPPPPAPHAHALAAIARLRARTPRSHEETVAFCTEAAALLRDYAAERFQLRVREKTTQELLVAVPSEHLARALGSCDLAKFARKPPDSAARGRLLDAGEAFVRESMR
ncbi:MAG: hypothetical protein ACT4PV_15465 [Planctomycetaceae bacterium]